MSVEHLGPEQIADLVGRAAGGERAAFDALVRGLAPVVWSVVRAHRLAVADAEDVVQGVWLRLAQHLGRLREPARLPGWLATTTRFECFAVMRRAARESAHGVRGSDARPGATEGLDRIGEELGERAGDVVSEQVEAGLADTARRQAVRSALETLDARCRELLALVAHVPPLSYQDISEMLHMPVASIGPTRGRCLEKVRRHRAIRTLMEGD